MKFIQNLWKKFISWQYHQYVDPEVIGPEIRPKVLGEITINQAYNLLREHCKPENIFLSDPSYSVTSKTEGKKFNEITKVDELDYIKDIRDCDNFSFALHYYWNKGLESFATGIAWSRNHAFCFMIDNRNKVWIIEPQSNKWFKIEDVKDIERYYPWRLVIM